MKRNIVNVKTLFSRNVFTIQSSTSTTLIATILAKSRIISGMYFKKKKEAQSTFFATSAQSEEIDFPFRRNISKQDKRIKSHPVISELRAAKQTSHTCGKKRRRNRNAILPDVLHYSSLRRNIYSAAIVSVSNSFSKRFITYI